MCALNPLTGALIRREEHAVTQEEGHMTTEAEVRGVQLYKQWYSKDSQRHQSQRAEREGSAGSYALQALWCYVSSLQMVIE